MQTFPQQETHFLLPGPSGDLEVLVTPMPNAKSIAIICHPHPLHGGTMNNKVVTTLARTMKDLKLASVRFNFRGVGKSAGVFDHGNGELDDLLAVVKWVKSLCPHVDIWLAGFSFGSFIAAKAAAQLSDIKQLICVAPPVRHFDIESLPVINCPWIIVQGEKDEVISPEAVYHWAEHAKHKPLLIRIADAGHFFHGKLLELRQRLEEALS